MVVKERASGRKLHIIVVECSFPDSDDKKQHGNSNPAKDGHHPRHWVPIQVSPQLIAVRGSRKKDARVWVRAMYAGSCALGDGSMHCSLWSENQPQLMPLTGNN